MSIYRLTIAAALVAVLAACGDKEPTGPAVPGALRASVPSSFTGIAGSPVATGSLPSVTVTTARGAPIAGVPVRFAISAGGGSIPGGVGEVLSDASGTASVPGWTLGSRAGANVMTATVSGVAPVTFTVAGEAGAPAQLALVVAPSATAANRAVFTSQPVVEVHDVPANVVTTSRASVTAAIDSGGGTLAGTVTVSAVNGIATFTDLAIAGPIGKRSLRFAADGLAATSAVVTTTVGPASTLAITSGNDQVALTNTAVPIAPSVIVRDADGTPVPGAPVVFAVTGGGGSLTGASALSGPDGVATVGGWTLGAAPGTNTLSAAATGAPAGQVSFTATAVSSLVVVSAVAPATLTPGIAATITGSGFSPTPTNNSVPLDGVPLLVTAATPTMLWVAIPSLLPCTPTHDAVLSVTVDGTTSTRLHPLQVAAQHALSPGQSVLLETAAAARCNELSTTGGLYYLNVYNSNTTYSTTGAGFELRGTAGASAWRASTNVVTPLRAPARRPSAAAAPARAHITHLERDLQFLRQRGPQWRQGATRMSSVALGGGRAYAVGDQVHVRLRDLRADGCDAYLDIQGRVAYIGEKAIIVEDTANPLAGTIDTTYAQIGSEFDTVMWPLLAANFGNALANDAVLDNNGRLVMVFTHKINELFPGLGGFVSTCDVFQRSQAASSNVGEYFYASSPSVPGNIAVAESPPWWRWIMREAVLHEVKHIVMVSERFSRNNGAIFEESWLEETTAVLAEELYERARYTFGQRANIGYGSPSDRVGPFCGVRSSCGQARGFVRWFEELAEGWYRSSHDHSPLGRRDDSDFSFYATGWSLARWAIDASPRSEATILRGLTQEPTRTGVANFEQQMGTTLAAALPKWTMAMVVDDHPGVTVADAALRQPSWNLRDIYLGYEADFNVPWMGWPLAPMANTFGSFSRTGAVHPGTAAVIQLSGIQSARQLLELKANGVAAAAPAELRMIIVRVQ